MDHSPSAADIIDAFGGTSAVAELCDIKPPSVSEWKYQNRIPKARLMFLKLLRPDVFDSLVVRHRQATTAQAPAT